MATEVLMPQMGESIAEGTITRWLFKVGDRVERDQPLLEISTDKVDAEIPSPATGVLLEIRRQENETVPVNEIVAMIGEPGEQPASGTVKSGTVKSGTVKEEAAKKEASPREEAELAPQVEAAPETGGEMSLEERVRRFSSPLVRNIARQENVDLSQIAGSGIHGRVTKKDILAYLEKRQRGEVSTAAVAPAAAASPSAAGRAPGSFSVAAYPANENVVIEPMSRIRQITAAHMVYSKATSAHVSTVFHVDMSRVAHLRQRAKGNFFAQSGTKLTYMPFIFRAVTQALRQFPQLNAALDGNNIVYKKDVHLGMAVAMDRGLIVPVIRRADELSLLGLARSANDLADRARNKKLQPDETQGGTFTITNPGVFGSLFGTPIINQPQVAILGIGAIEKRPVVQTDEDGHDRLAIRTMSYFSLTFDHRLIDGADADHFMNKIKDCLEHDAWSELQPYL